MPGKVACLLLVAAAGAAAGAAVLASASSALVAPAKVKTTSGWVEALSMNRDLVVYALDHDASGCHKVIAWKPQTGWAGFVSGRRTGACGDDQASGQNVVALAVGGGRAAWIRNITGNTESFDRLYASSIVAPHERRLASALRRGDTSGVLAGDWLGGLVSDGRGIVVNRWRTDGSGAVVNGSLAVAGATTLKTLVSGSQTVVARSADAGRVAVLRNDGSIALYSTAGALLRTFPAQGAREVALRTEALVVLTSTKTLVVNNANTGALVTTWPVPSGASHLDVHSGVAVFAADRHLYALRLATGKTVVLGSAPRAISHVQIESAGVVYAFNTVRKARSVGNLEFVPLARVIHAVS